MGFDGVFAVDRFSRQSWGGRILKRWELCEGCGADGSCINQIRDWPCDHIRIEKAIEALKFYAKGEHLGLEDWQIDQILKDDDVFAESYVETGKRARKCLAEIE